MGFSMSNEKHAQQIMQGGGFQLVNDVTCGKQVTIID